MIVPVVIDSQQYERSRPPRIGDRVSWELFWAEHFARSWSGLEPDWQLTAEAHASDHPPMTRIGASPEDDVTEFVMIGSAGGLRFAFHSEGPAPDRIAVSGALSVTTATLLDDDRFGKPWHDADPAATTTGIVTRLRVVSLASDWRPGRYPGWMSLRQLAGTEWFYELAEPPAQLRFYRPIDGDVGHRRDELLLVDLDV